MIEIRAERPQDVPAIHGVDELAFGRPVEADMVDRLRHSCAAGLSLVAEDDGVVVGHVLFTPVVIDDDRGPVAGMGLAPVAVTPARQGHGIGTALVEGGLEELRAEGCPFAVVLGHPGFYPRFGFERASAHGLTSQWDGIPDEAFMVLLLDPDTMAGVSGVARYRDEFNAAV